MAGERVWQASDAQANFAAVMDGALSGTPQVIRRRSGEDVVVLSHADFERMWTTLKDYLLRSADDDDTLEDALRCVRGMGALGLAPRGADEEN